MNTVEPQSNKQRISPAITMLILAVLTLTVLQTAWWCHQARAAAAQTASQAERAEGFVARITLARNQTGSVVETRKDGAVIAAVIESAASQAGVPLDQLARINPEPPQPSDEPSVSEIRTGFQVNGITMPQLAVLMAEVHRQDTSLVPDHIRLIEPRREAPSNAWDVEVGLAYLLYDPTNTSVEN